MQKIITSMLILFSVLVSSGQESRFSMALNYSPNYSNITNDVVPARMKLSHDVGVALAYSLTTSISPTLSFRYFDVGEVTGGVVNSPVILESTFAYSYAYLHIPVGLRMKVGRFEILPEIGYAIALSQTVTSKIVTVDETRKSSRPEELVNGEFNDRVIPVSLTLSSDIMIGSVTTQVGLKGYYSTNMIAEGVPRDNHFYGVGLLVGVKL